MATTASAGREAVQLALTAARSEDLIKGVKAAVVKELEGLDPTATIKTTDYFNHTFAPDLELSWPDKRQQTRLVYLRYSLSAAVAGQDFRALGPLSPVVLALRDDLPEEIEEARRNIAEAEDARGLLATDVGALDDLEPATVEDDSPPLLELVRGNLVQGARGLLVGESMRTLVSSAASTELQDPVAQAAQLDTFNAMVDRSFLPESATRLIRAGQLVRAGKTGDLAPFRQETDTTETAGQLSYNELRVLLPYFLRPDAPQRDMGFWRYLGSMTTLANLESMWDVLLDSDLGAFIQPNVDMIVARRAQLVHRVDVPDDIQETTGSSPDNPSSPKSTRQPGWQIRSRRLCLNTDLWRVFFTSDQRGVKGRDDSLPARWDDISGPLRQFDLVRVNLRGAARRLEVTAEQAADVYGDVSTIRGQIHDDFHVPAVTVRPRRAHAADLSADFTSMVVDPISGSAPLQDLGQTALRLLGHRYPSSEEDLAQLSLPSTSPPDRSADQES